MDFKNILHKNVGNMKSKLPSMPKIPKIKSRKIFNLNRSKENVSIEDGNFATSQLSIGGASPHQSQLQLPPPPSAIINRSPSRISTISSLVEGGQPIDYNISDDGGGGGRNRNRRRIHFDDKPDQNNDKSTPCFTERLTKQYKELSEFKFSHIFGKKTIVRRTEIQVDMYTQSFEDQTNELAAERRLSRDYEFEFRSIPAIGSNNNSADEPHTPTAPSVHSIPSRTPSTAFGFQQQSPPSMNSQISNVDEIKNYAGSISPPLSKRKVFNQKDHDESVAADEAAKQKKQNWKIKSWKKKSLEIFDDGGDNGTRKDSIKSKSNSGMWQIKRPSRIPASQDSIDENQEVTTDSFKKSLNNIFKKLPSLSSFDDASDGNTKSPKKPGMWKLQRPVRVKVSTENIPNELNDSSDSEFMKQFNIVVGKSSKIKKIIGKEPTSTNQTTENVSSQQQIEDHPSKVKTMEEIESLGYGRKNLKYISMWKIRRRREIRRNEPFQLNRGNSQEDESLKTPGMWQLRRPTRTKTVINEGDPINSNPQLAEITKSLMNLFKRKQNSVEPTSVDEQIQEQNKCRSISKQSTLTDEYIDKSGSLPAQSRMWKFRQAIGKESFDTDVHFNQADIENKPGFWKKMSHKRKDSKNEDNCEENIVNKPPGMLDKAKKQITSRINSIQLKSNESQESQQEPVKCNEAAASIDFKKKLQNSMDSFESCNDSDPETLEDLERINRNLTWGRQNMLSNAYSTDSDDEDVITTPGFLQNQPISSVHYGEIEPTIIIVSKPVPTILQYESVIQQERLYPLLPIKKPSTPPPTTPPPPLPNNSSQFLELPNRIGLPTPPPPKRQISLPLIAQPDNILTPPQSPTPSSKSPTPPLLPTSLPPELSPSSESLPPPLPLSPRPQLSTLFKTSPILEESSNSSPYLDNKSRYKHSRKPSMDSNDSETWIPTDNLKNRNVLELNKIEETFEQWNSVNKSKTRNDPLKKWQSIDIFIGNDDEIFDDFEDQLKNEPIITIAENISSQQQSILNDIKSNPDPNQPSGVPVTFEKHKITRPLVKQGSLRRQFSEEKDAEDLNKKRNVNKMISRFDPERGSSRRSIKYDRSQNNSTIIIGSTKDNDEKIILKKEIEVFAIESDENHNSFMRNLKESSSLDVEIDKNDVQSIDDSTTDDDSDNSNSIIQGVPARPPTVLARKKAIDNNNIAIKMIPEKNVMVIERKLAPQPPSKIKPTALVTKTMINNNQNEDKQEIMKKDKQPDAKPIIKEPMTIKTVKDSNENNIRNLNIKKNILQQSRQQSEDNFYSLDYTEEDETVKGYPLDGMSLVKEEYSIEL